MADQKAIQNKIKTVGNIRKITSAMEMIARTKMKKAVDGVLSVRPYALYAQELLMHLSADKTLESPYLSSGKGEKILLVVIASDKGLCGGYNANVNRLLKAYLAENQNVEVLAMGKRAILEAKKLGLKTIAEYKDVPDKVSSEYVSEISKELRKAFRSGEFKKVEAIYTDYVSSFSQKAQTRTILPVSVKGVTEIIEKAAFGSEKKEELNDGEGFGMYLLEPNVETILNTVVPRLVDVSVLHSILESKASEESMRMFAMKNATENAKELQDDLTLSYNRARQQGITQEIAEIAAGAEALG
ncbi:MAG: ATP synthase F1 subunit gamma [bacterium]|nr:ATP synthase F1 subunit gamma [bacterium]